MKRNVVLILLFILLPVILALALAMGSVLLLRLFSLVILVLLLSFLWTLLGIRGLTARVRESAECCQVGGRFGEEITVFSNSRLPKFLIKAEENTDLPGHDNMAVFSLSPKGYYRWQTEVYCRRRGQYRLGVLTVTVTDPFGLFSWRRSLGEPQNLFVYPATLALPFFQPLSLNEPGSGPGRWLTGELGPEAARVREYTSGDTLKHIHWRSTAHVGRLMVKEFDANRADYASRDVWLVLDLCQASQVGEGDEGTEECGVTIAASLIKKYLDDSRRVGLIASGDQPYLFLPETGSQHLWQVLEALALMKASGKMPVEQLLGQEIERLGTNSVIIVVTPATSERLMAPLRQLKSYGVMVIVISLDSVSFGGTVRAVNAVASLVASGCQVYVVRHGEELAKALDSRMLVRR